VFTFNFQAYVHDTDTIFSSDPVRRVRITEEEVELKKIKKFKIIFKPFYSLIEQV